MQTWISRVSVPWLKPLALLNVLCGDEGMVTALAIPLALFVLPVPANLFVALAVLASPRIEQGLKELCHRGRPRDPNELGFPSGDCSMVTLWSVPVLGWWAAAPIFLVAWARVARGAHWPLDTVGGVALGLSLVLPILR